VKIEAQPTTPIDWTKPIETTDGFPARVISEDYRAMKSGKFLRIVQVEYERSSSVYSVHNNGCDLIGDKVIRNRKTKREGWINIFPDQWVGCSYESEEAARRHPNAKGAIATIKIEWEE
jgi:hypothetical protein